jgi:signal transduction histidine kinase
MLVDSLISECFVKIGRPDSALQYFRSYEVLKDSVRSVQKLKTIMDVSARYETEKKEQEIKILEKEAAYQKLLAKNHNQQKNIAWISIALIMAGGGYFTYRYIRKRKLQNQQVVLNERLRISRELHDEVGSTLSGIAMVSHLTKEQIKAAKTEQVEKSLSTINQSATEMVGKLSDIIWLVNPGKDSFQQLIERLDEFATEVAGTKDIDLKINVETDLAQVDLPVDKRREIYLFCKEAINNAIKYSNAGLITLTIRETDNKKINVFITDNGDGFDPLRVRKGNGLTNMQQRVEKINGEYLLQTSPGSGTKHSLLFKIT